MTSLECKHVLHSSECDKTLGRHPASLAGLVLLHQVGERVCAVCGRVCPCVRVCSRSNVEYFCHVCEEFFMKIDVLLKTKCCIQLHF